MSFVATLSEESPFIPTSLSKRLQDTYADTIKQVNDHLNAGCNEERHRTATLVNLLNDRVGKDVMLAMTTAQGFNTDFVPNGMKFMRYLPQEQAPTIELLYRILSLGALESAATQNPRMKNMDDTLQAAREKSIAEAYTRVHGGDTSDGIAFAASVRSEIKNGLAHGR